MILKERMRQTRVSIPALPYIIHVIMAAYLSLWSCFLIGKMAKEVSTSRLTLWIIWDYVGTLNCVLLLPLLMYFVFFFLLLIFVLCAYFQFLYSCVYFYTSFKPFLLVLCFKVQRIFRRELTFDEGLSDFDSMKEHYFMKCNMLLSTSLAWDFWFGCCYCHVILMCSKPHNCFSLFCFV